MRWALLLVAASLKTVIASPIRGSDSFGDHVAIPRDLPPGTLVMDAATIAMTDFGDEEPVIYVPAPTHTLTPSIHHDHDTSEISHLDPHHSKALYFAQGKAHTKPYFDAKYLHADTTFKYPAVVLEHSCHVSATIFGGRMTINFSNQEAFERIRSKWMDASTQHPIILITTTGSRDGHFVYYLITDVVCNDETWSCVLKATVANFDDLLENYVVSWGHVDHPKAKRAPFDDTESSLKARQASSQGLSFDQRLDQQLGYHSWDPSTFESELKDWAPGLDDFNYDDYNDQNADVDGIYGADGHIDIDDSNSLYYDSGAPIREERRRAMARRAMERRLIDLKRAVKAIDKAVVRPIAKKVDQVKQKVVQFTNNVVIPAVKKVVSYIDGTPHPFDTSKEFIKPSPDDMKPDKYKTLPYWKNETGGIRTARELYTAKKGNLVFEVYCVDCGVRANFKFNGVVAFNIARGLEQANVRVTGNLDAGVGLGLVAGYTYEFKDQMRLFTVGIPGLSVPNFVNIGPLLTVDAVYGWNLNLVGTFLAGGRLTLNNIDATIDVINSANSKKPSIKPEFKHYFQANAQVTANVFAGVAAGIAVGLDIANGKASASATVQSEPKINAKFTASIGTGTPNTGNGACSGIGLQVDVEHSLYAVAKYQFFSIKKGESPRYKFTNDYSLGLGKQCFAASKSKRQDSGDAMVFSDLDEPQVTLFEEPQGTALEAFSNFTEADLQDYVWPAPIDALFSGNAPSYASSPDTPPSDQTATSFNYSIIMDSGSQYLLASTNDGNLAFQPISDPATGANLFATSEDMVLGDSFGRTLVYYHKELEQYSVSRVRLVDADKVPLSSGSLALVPIDDGKTISTVSGAIPEAYLYGADGAGNLFWLAKCDYTDGTTTSKIFIVKDPETGPQALTDATLVDVLTGGALDSCQLVGLLSGALGY